MFAILYLKQIPNLVSATGCGFESLRRYPWKPPYFLELTRKRIRAPKSSIEQD
jgi:hypothetical protein